MGHLSRSSRWRWLALLAVAAIVCGPRRCVWGQPPAAGSSSSAAIPRPESREYWDAYYFEDSKVGYVHTVYEAVKEGDRDLVRISSDSELTLQRFGQTIKQRLEFTSWELPSGEVVRCSSKISNETPGTDAAAMTATGNVEGNQLVLQVTTLNKTQTATIPWDRKWGGYFAAEQSLERTPMKPGEKRQLRALAPGFNQVADLEFQAIDLAATKLLDREERLLRIETKIKLGDNVLEQTVWTDQSGQTLKSFMPALKQTSYRTSRTVALGRSNGQFDLGARTTVSIQPPLQDAHRRPQITYRATLMRGDPARAFARGATQTTRVVDKHTVEITVRTLQPDQPLGEQFPAEPGPQSEDLASNSLIQCDDPQVKELARQVAEGKQDSWEIALSMERFVREYVANKGFAQALASAAEVLRTREGDCTEHAVLLAALCRAREIPARVAIGLVYSQAAGGFAYHMWTEVWIKDRWLPLDGTLGLGGIGAAHLKVANTNLQGVDPFTHFLPVFQLIGNLQIEVVR